MPGTPSITVVMAAYNAGTSIHRAIESLKQQTLSDWELIVIDDCSNDNTRDVAEAFAQRDPRIHYERMPENKGPAAARNIGFAHAHGDWITILDSDDVYEVDRLQFLLEQARAQQADLVADNMYYFDPGLNKIVRKAFALKGKSLPLTAERLTRYDGPPLIFSCGLLQPLIRRDFLVRTQVSYNEKFRVGEDFCFLFALLRKGARAFIFDKPGYIYFIPFGKKSSGTPLPSLKDYVGEEYDQLIKSSEWLAGQILRETPANTELAALLHKRKTRFLREKAWKEARYFLRQKDFSSLLGALCKVNLLPHFCAKMMNHFRKSQPIT